MYDFQPLDLLPIWGIFLFTVVILILSSEGGYRLGNLFKKRWPDHSEAGVGAMVGASLAFLGFLLAFVANMAVNIYNARQELVTQEANAIGTAYMQAGYLEQPISTKSRKLLIEYAQLRLAALDRSQRSAAIARSEEIHNELWGMAEVVARDNPTPVTALYIGSLGKVMDLHTERVKKELAIRVPPFFLLSVLLVAVFSMLLIGVYGSYAEKLNYLSLFVMVLILSIVFLVIVDLDRSHQGLITIPQSALTDLLRQMQTAP